MVNGYQGTSYSTVAAERSDIFKPLVASTVQQVLGRPVVYSVVGRGGELRGISISQISAYINLIWLILSLRDISASR